MVERIAPASMARSVWIEALIHATTAYGPTDPLLRTDER